MMIFLYEITIRENQIKFWSGFDTDKIQSHPKDGSSGFMVVLIESIDAEKIKWKRNLKINKIFDSVLECDFDKFLDNLKNDYVLLYQSNGEDEILIEILKKKFNESQIW